MNNRDTRAAILEAQTLAFVQALDAQGGPPWASNACRKATVWPSSSCARGSRLFMCPPVTSLLFRLPFGCLQVDWRDGAVLGFFARFLPAAHTIAGSRAVVSGPDRVFVLCLSG